MPERDVDAKPEAQPRPEPTERTTAKPAERKKLSTDTLDDNPLIFRGLD